MNLLSRLLPNLSTSLTGNLGNQSVQITFKPALPPEIRTQIATQPLTLTVSNTQGNQLTLTTPQGLQLTATINPPLPVGTQLQLSTEALLPGTPQPSTPLPIQAKILPPETTTPQPSQPQPTAPVPLPSLLTQSSESRITNTELRVLFTTSLLQQAATAASPAPSTPLPVPSGPVAATLPPKFPATLLGQPLILTPSGPMADNGTQLATVAPLVPQSSGPGTAPQPIRFPVTLNLGIPLPVNQPQPAIILSPAPLPAESPLPQPTQPVLVLTGTPATPTMPMPPAPGQSLQVPAPSQSQTLQPTTVSLPLPTPVAARILPPVPGQSPDTQSALLATGTTLTVNSSQPLPIGSIIVADFPITPTSTIQRVLSSDSQPQSQPNVNQQSQAAAPVPVQSPQAVLASGTVIQGTITGQNEQGQPILTITQPGALAGQSVPITLAEPTALMPVGAQVSIRIEANLSATILTLTLPPQAQSAFTVNTLGNQWDSLHQALTLLQQQAPQQAANLRASLPQLANLLPGLINFTNALRTNRAEDAFDTEATRLLKAMGIDLSSDISQLSQLQQRPASQDPQWRGTLFPYVEAPGEDPRQGGFFWRREKSDNPRSPTHTRFVVELEMSRLGAMQLDGLVTYPEIWLKLRRTASLEPGFTEGLQALVSNLLQASGLTGGISVEVTQSFPVNPRAELLSQSENPLPTTA